MDLRVDNIFFEEMKDDKSFTEKTSVLEMLFGGNKFSQKEIRETWDNGVKLGIEIGLRRASLEGQRIELMQNTTNERHKEYLKKSYELAAEYNCAIQYHPKVGMVVIDYHKGY